MTVLERTQIAPAPAMPPRPSRPLSTWQMLRTAGSNSLAIWDEAMFDELVVERRYLHQRLLVVSDPDGVRRILVDNFENYRRADALRRLLLPALGTGILINDGEVWRRHRTLLNPLLDYRATIPDVPMLTRWTETLARHLSEVAPGEPIHLGNALSMLAAISVGHFFAGDDPEIDLMLARMAKFPGERRATDFLPLPSWLRSSRRTAAIRAEAEHWYPLLDRLIAKRRGADYEGGHDLLWRMVHATGRDGDRLSDAEIRDEILTFANGGLETTLRAMCWIWYLLALHPEVEMRFHAELDRVLGGRSPSVDEIGKLVYLRRVVDETMRLYPPVPVMLRSVASDDVICGRPVRRGTLVVVAPWIVHRHRRLWPDPDRFDPDRFAPEAVAARSRYSYLPFSAGPRTCIAASLAMLQIVLMAAILGQQFRFRLVPGHRIEPIGWSTLRPGGGIYVTVEPR